MVLYVGIVKYVLFSWGSDLSVIVFNVIFGKLKDFFIIVLFVWWLFVYGV